MVTIKKLQVIANALLVLMAVMLMGCANYQIGDLSSAYCRAQTPELKAYAKSKLESMGTTIDVDYCTAYRVAKAIRGN